MLKININYTNNILYVSLDGILNRMTSYKINNYLIPVILKRNIKCLVYDLDNLNILDDAGVDALLNTKYAIKDNKGSIYLNGKINDKNIKRLKLKKYKLLEA